VPISDLPPLASTPAFDARVFNPVGWTPAHDRAPSALAPRSRGLLSGTRTLRGGVPSKVPGSWQRLSLAHHVQDTAAYHSSSAACRASRLAALAATGAVIRLNDSAADVAEYLGAELLGLMTAPGIADANAREREMLSIAMRRAAWRDHSQRARTRQMLELTGQEGSSLPSVSVLLATRRPERLQQAVAAVAAQTYPHLELILAPHGEGFDPASVDGALEALSHPAQAVHVSGTEPLGAVLNAAAAASSGELMTKFDDDDLYDGEHLWDLVSALDYSGADIAGKGSEYVYLAGADCTLRRFPGQSERYVRHGRGIAGGTLIFTRACFEAVGGWPRIVSGVDWELLQSVRRHDGAIYRTHGSGYLLMRHGEGHTWAADESEFLSQAEQTRDGLDLEFAGIQAATVTRKPPQLSHLNLNTD